MKFSSLIVPAFLASTAFAAPSSIKSRSVSLTGSWDSYIAGPYTIYQNLWGAAQATSGSQTTLVEGTTSGLLKWSTSWTWLGGSSSVKSYNNADVVDINKQLSAITSIPSIWKWKYTGTDIVADVSYDMWLAPTSGGTNSYEIMVWLGALGGAGPISSTGSAVATPTINGAAWKLYKGANGDTTVFSFVADTEQTSWDGDMMDFLTYLINDEGVSSSLWVTSIGAGTEPFTGTNCVLTTSGYSLSVST